MRALRVAAMLPTRPLEFWDRLSIFVELRLDRWRSRPEYPRETWDQVVAALARHLHVDAGALLAEALGSVEAELRRGAEGLRAGAPYPPEASGDFRLGRACYLICRALRPQAVVETGVLYGVTSAFILQAMESNGTGMLHSVDLPPARARAEDFVGRLVPPGLRRRWTLHRGASRRVLPPLLRALPPVGLFVHDSLHTYRNMRWELETVAPFLDSRSAVISDDVHDNAAFLEWMTGRRHAYAAAVPEEEKPALFGVTLAS